MLYSNIFFHIQVLSGKATFLRVFKLENISHTALKRSEMSSYYVFIVGHIMWAFMTSGTAIADIELRSIFFKTIGWYHS